MSSCPIGMCLMCYNETSSLYSTAIMHQQSILGKRAIIEIGSNSMLTTLKSPKPPDKQPKTFTFTEPPTTDVITIYESDSFAALFT
ncbi:hypothetical protein BB561_006155 [Smittium simulii]|uniref:Uncharacterized protein n=1 Tax=Smittium simulii TaxID=133385 RepID=A0A2T9Y664_9FUNG|nr:hypothetical protein BB561_006155 [Smittium simulii]